jgi:hypothetical protein
LRELYTEEGSRLRGKKKEVRREREKWNEESGK